MKLPLILFIWPTAVALFLFSAGCTKVPQSPLPSARFAGNFDGNETCLFNAALSDTLHIIATGSAQVSITNFYGLPGAVTGTVSNDSCVIQPQLCSGYVVQGLLLLSNDTITLFALASNFGREDKCNAVLVKE